MNEKEPISIHRNIIKEKNERDKIKIAIVCLYGYPHKHDTEPFAGQVLKQQLDQKFSGEVESNIFLLGHNGESDEEIELFARQLIEDNENQVIGISIPQGTLPTAEKFLSSLQRLGFEGQIILGHSLPTYLPEIFLQQFPQAIIARGWGEDTFCQIIEGQINDPLVLAEIPNLTYIENGQIVNNEIVWPREFIPSSHHDPSKYFPRIEASRGCHHDVCTYCTRPLRSKSQPSWVRIPPEIVIQDIHNLKKSGVEKFTFTDEDFFGDDLEGAMMIAEALKEVGGMTFALDLRADSILNPNDTPKQAEYRDKLLRTLVEAGLSLIYVGVETLSKTQLRRYGKGVTPEDEIAAVKKVASLSVPIELGLITFDPMLSLQELKENVEGLEQSGIWVFGSQLFSELRVIEGNPYCNILKNHDLERDFDPNYMTHHYSYLHPEIEHIRNLCIPIKRQVDSIYTSARNIFRTNFHTPDFIERYIVSYRERELKVLKSLLENPENHLQVIEEARQNEYLSIQQLKHDLDGIPDDDNYSELIENITKYLDEE